AAIAPRDYQLELLEHAKRENAIAVMETGAGKTLVSALLIRHLTRRAMRGGAQKKPARRIVAFLVNHLSLVEQQAVEIRRHCPYTVAEYRGGMMQDLWDMRVWREEVAAKDIMVMTVQILLNALRHGFLSINELALIIIDECHHSKKRHPYNEMMREFYWTSEPENRPRIFAMTASPLDAKRNVAVSAGMLEQALGARIFTVSNIAALRRYIIPPRQCILHYDPSDTFDATPLYRLLRRFGFSDNLRKLFSDAEYALSTLGPWCSDHVWFAYLRDVNQRFPHEFALNRYLNGIKCPETRGTTERVIKIIRRHTFEPPTLSLRHMSPKLLRLIEVLTRFARQLDNFQGIVFVDRRKTAFMLLDVIRGLPHMEGIIRAEAMVGSGSADMGDKQMSYVVRNKVVDKFRQGHTNLLIATNVGEEGLDIPKCNVVIRQVANANRTEFGFFSTLRAYIQSRGRARSNDSAYIIMQETGNAAETKLLQQIRVHEAEMNAWCQRMQRARQKSGVDDNGDVDVEDYGANDTGHSEHAYVVASTGARVTFSSAIPIIHRYCSQLRTDDYSEGKPIWKWEAVSNNDYVYTLILPTMAAVREVKGDVMRTKSLAKRLVALRACEELHKLGALDDHLLPEGRRGKLSYDNEDDEEEEKDADGGSISTLYPRKTPLSWVPRSKEADTWYIHVLKLQLVKDPELATPLHTRYRPFALFCPRPMSSMDTVRLHLDEGECKVIVQAWQRSYLVNAQCIKRLKTFTAVLLTHVLRKPVAASNVGYVVAPLLLEHMDEEHLERSIDWDEIYANQSDTLDRPITDVRQLRPGSLVEDIDRRNQLNKVTGVREALPIDTVLETRTMPDGSTEAVSVADFVRIVYKCEPRQQTQTLLEVEPVRRTFNYLLQREVSGPPKKIFDRLSMPERCRVLPVSADVFSTAMLLPSLLYRLEAALLAFELGARFELKTSPEHLLEAITAPQAGVAAHYERLEVLGDSFLKMATSTSLFLDYTLTEEGRLHSRRIRIISNRALRLSALQRELYVYTMAQSFNRRRWLPRGYYYALPGDSKGRTQDSLSKKMISDVVEACMGACMEVCGLDGALHCAIQLGVPFGSVKQWKDFAPLREPPAYVTPGMLSELDYTSIEEKIGYTFQERSYLLEAYTHSSFPDSSRRCYERLEFLGDAVLDFLTVDLLFHRYPDMQPGGLVDLKDAIVSNEFLSTICDQYGLQRYLMHFSEALLNACCQFSERLAKKKKKNQGLGEYWRDVEAPKVMGDVVEATLGAVYLDSGFDLEAPRGVFNRLIRPLIDEKIKPGKAHRSPIVRLTLELQKHGCSNFKFK
ncbi:hypothetical protein THASP1DRAFT_16494, partial [Thamnocephalis sphaerospora]